MSKIVNFLPKLTGSFALPASENPTIEMVEAAYRHHKMHMRYINVEVGSLIGWLIDGLIDWLID